MADSVLDGTNSWERCAHLLPQDRRSWCVSFCFSLIITLSFSLDAHTGYWGYLALHMSVFVAYMFIAVSLSCCLHSAKLLTLVHSVVPIFTAFMFLLFTGPPFMLVWLLSLTIVAHLLLAVAVCPERWNIATQLAGAPLCTVVTQLLIISNILMASLTYGIDEIDLGIFVMGMSVMCFPMVYAGALLLDFITRQRGNRSEFHVAESDGVRASSALSITISILVVLCLWFVFAIKPPPGHFPSVFIMIMLSPLLCMMVRHALLERFMADRGNGSPRGHYADAHRNMVIGSSWQQVLRRACTLWATYEARHMLLVISSCVTIIGSAIAMPSFYGKAVFALVGAMTTASALVAVSVSSILSDRGWRHAPISDLNFRLTSSLNAIKVVLKLVAIYSAGSVSPISRTAASWCGDRVPQSYTQTSDFKPEALQQGHIGEWQDTCPGCFTIYNIQLGFKTNFSWQCDECVIRECFEHHIARLCRDGLLLWYQEIDDRRFSCTFHHFSGTNVRLGCIDPPRSESVIMLLTTTIFAVVVKAYTTFSSVARAWSNPEVLEKLPGAKSIMLLYLIAWVAANVGLSLLTIAGARNFWPYPWFVQMCRPTGTRFVVLMGIVSVVGSCLVNELSRCFESSSRRQSAVASSTGVFAVIPVVLVVAMSGTAGGAVTAWQMIFGSPSPAGGMILMTYNLNIFVCIPVFLILVVAYSCAGHRPTRTHFSGTRNPRDIHDDMSLQHLPVHDEVSPSAPPLG